MKVRRLTIETLDARVSLTPSFVSAAAEDSTSELIEMRSGDVCSERLEQSDTSEPVVRVDV